MKNMERFLFVALAVGVFVLPTTAQTKKWTYHADNGGEGFDRQEITIVITQAVNGYEVSGEFVNKLASSATCPIHGQYFPKTKRFSARADCRSASGRADEQAVNGFKRGNELQITQPWSSVARLEGTKPKPKSGEDSTDSSPEAIALGTWKGTYKNSKNQTGTSSISFQMTGGKLTGVEDGVPIEEVTLRGNVVSFKYKANACHTFEGELEISADGKTASGKYEATGCNDEYTGQYIDYRKQ